MKNKKWVISSLCCLLPMIVGILLYDILPPRIPIHFNGNGEIDGYGTKAVVVFGLPIGMALLNYFTGWMLRKDPKNTNIPNVMANITLIFIPVMTWVGCAISILTALKIKVDVNLIIITLLGIVLMIIGNYLPKCKQSYTLGIKTPWALNNEENWRKTHRLGGILWSIAGIVLIVNEWFLNSNMYVFLIALFAMVIVPFIYSYMQYAKGEK